MPPLLPPELLLLDVPPEELLEEPPLEPPVEQLGHRQTGQHPCGGVTAAQGAAHTPEIGHSQTAGWQTPFPQSSVGLQSASVVQSPQALPQFGSQDPATSTWSALPPPQALVV